jgi:hypothetical protein
MNGKTLTAGTDYTVSYKNNTDPGKATVTITGKGSYTGTKTTTFKIVPKKATLKKAVKNQKKAIKVTWKKDAKADGYQISISTSKKFKGKVKNVLVKKNKIVTKVVKNLKSKTTYYVRIRAYKTIDGQKVYGAYSKVKKVKTK